jgi:hypothetical protein
VLNPDVTQNQKRLGQEVTRAFLRFPVVRHLVAFELDNGHRWDFHCVSRGRNAGQQPVNCEIDHGGTMLPVESTGFTPN